MPELEGFRLGIDARYVHSLFLPSILPIDLLLSFYFILCSLLTLFFSIWLNQCHQVFARAHVHAGRHAPLRTIFYRLGQLAALPVIPVFVFDGPQRPARKRGGAAFVRDHPLGDGMKQLIQAFGFACHDVSHPSALYSRLPLTFLRHLVKRRPSWH